MATELLQQHVSNGDGLFQGVSDLLLAYALGDESSAEKFLEEGHDAEKPCRWPDEQDMRLPKELLKGELRKTDTSAVARFPTAWGILDEETLNALRKFRQSRSSDDDPYWQHIVRST